MQNKDIRTNLEIAVVKANMNENIWESLTTSIIDQNQ